MANTSEIKFLPRKSCCWLIKINKDRFFQDTTFQQEISGYKRIFQINTFGSMRLVEWGINVFWFLYSHCRPLYNFATSFCGTNICNKRELVFKVGKQVNLVCSLQILGLVFLRYLKLFWIFSHSLHYTQIDQIVYWYNWFICCINMRLIFSYVS